MPNAAPNYKWDHIHLRSPDPEATAAWFERILGAEVIRSMQQGKPRVDLKLGGADIFIMPVGASDKVNPPPVTPYQGLDHFGFPCERHRRGRGRTESQRRRVHHAADHCSSRHTRLLSARTAGYLDRTSGARREIRVTGGQGDHPLAAPGPDDQTFA